MRMQRGTYGTGQLRLGALLLTLLHQARAANQRATNSRVTDANYLAAAYLNPIQKNFLIILKLKF